MTTALKRSMIAATIVLCGTISASATNYTFDDGGVGHDWDTEDNWNPPGTPASGDNATIPNTFTCEIAIANQAIGDLTIDSGGVLQIKGRDLTIVVGALNDALTVNGRLEFLKPGDDDPRLVIDWYGLEIDGDGTISASAGDNLDPGIIEGSLGPYAAAYVRVDGLTLKGSLKIRTDLRNNGELLVDHADDVMEIGYMNTTSHTVIFGNDTGTFRVANGAMKFGRTAALDFQSDWKVEGGTLTLTEYATDMSWVQTEHAIDISAGTLDIDSPLFGAWGPFRFRGGNIRVAAGSFAGFLTPLE